MHRYSGAAVVGYLLVAVLAVPTCVAGATNVVQCGAGADLQAAIEAASAGDTLVIRGTCIGSFAIHQDLTLVGGARATLDARGSGPTLVISKRSLGEVAPAPHVSITDLVVTGGTVGIDFSGESGGDLPLGSLSVLSSSVSGNGLGIDSRWGTVTLRGSTVADNSADGIWTTTMSRVYLHRSTVRDNAGSGIRAQTQGGASIYGSMISGNVGAGIVVANGSVLLEDSTVRGNTASGISMPGPSPGMYLEVRNSTIAANSVADYGGGIYIGPNESANTMITIEDTIFKSNTAGISGGGIYNGGAPATLTNVRFRKNAPDDCFGC